MTVDFKERRRFPRVPLTPSQEFRLGRRVRVKVLDLSAGGALLSAEEALPPGTRGRLQVLLGPEQFEGQVEIRREQGVPGERGWLLGATLTPAQPRHREALDSFLRRAGN